MTVSSPPARISCSYGWDNASGLYAAYHAFGRAAELEDRSELLHAAGWQILGKTIIVALASRSTGGGNILFAKGDDRHDESDRIAWAKDLFIDAPDIRKRVRHIANNLGMLVDAGRKGGSISADSVFRIARTLDGEISTLLHRLDKVARSRAAYGVDSRPVSALR